ncbi:hypothetical protein A0257_03360 [Hymenobacter psoromatis]|nr:hypothetical protein A0257_03360 [Hymenobacter psoromatis]
MLVGIDMWVGLATLPPALLRPLLAAHDSYWPNIFLTLLVSLIALGLLLRVGNWQRAEFGLQLRTNAGTGRDVWRWLMPLLVLETGLLWLLLPGGHPTVNYQLVNLSVGITEELTFRGIFLALLNRAFPRRVRVLGAELGWGTVVSSLIFGLVHGLRVDAAFHPTLNLLPMAIPTVGGFVLAWCRARSGNLLLPIAVHSGMNELAQLIALVKG